MRRLRLIFIAASLAWLGLASTWSGRVEAAPVVDRVNPSIGQVGHVVVLTGRGLAGVNLAVSFGRAQALDAHNPGGSDQTIRVIVPNKVDPRDPDTVPVTVTVDGVEAVASTAPLQFTYDFPQPSATLTDYTTFYQDHPKSVVIGQWFVLSLSGTNFVIGRRAPQRCIAVGPGDYMVESAVIDDATSATHVSCFFTGLFMGGNYELLLAFSDGSGASILAPHFVPGEGPLFGWPPTIHSVSFETNPQGTVRCDFTQVLEDYLCSLGATAPKAEGGVFIGGTYTSVKFLVRATDPDSTPQNNNILVVTASFVQPDASAETSLALFDDASFNRFEISQQGNAPEDCPVYPDAHCECSPKVYTIVSGDQLTNDDLFTRNLAFVDLGTPQLGLLKDCILQQTQASLLTYAAGTTFDFRIEATDRQGNNVSWPTHPTATLGTGSFSCTGDECGCCLLTSWDASCKGLPGMPCAEFPNGICVSIF